MRENLQHLSFWVWVISVSLLYHMIAVLTETKRRSQSSGTGVIGNCEPLCGCWELNEARYSGRAMSALNF